MEQLGKLLAAAGVAIAIIGIIFMFGAKLPFRLGRLPLDIHFKRNNFNFYFPLGTSILISVVLTLIFALINRVR